MFVVKSKTQEASLLVVYIGLLFVAAVVRDFYITPYVAQHMHGIGAVLIEPIWKLLFWIIPTFLYIQFVEHQNPLTYLKLTSHPLKGLGFGLIGCIPLVALELGSILRSHTFHGPQSADIWVNTILLVGLMEEIPFRGFLFQKLKPWLGFVGSMLLTSVLFALIHIPIWISTGVPFSLAFFLGQIMVFLVGSIACIVLELSDSLWASIVVHTFYNTLISILA